MQLKKIYYEDNIETMKRMPDDYIDLIVTSPPYDDLRSYGGNASLDLSTFIPEVYRIMKPLGVVVWVIADRSDRGSESLSSFKQAIAFTEGGFSLNDTMIYSKPNRRPRQTTSHRYEQTSEFMFVFVKNPKKMGKSTYVKSKTFNPILENCLHAGKSIKMTSRDYRNDHINAFKNLVVSQYKKKGNIWHYTNNIKGVDHPAKFPRELARDHIYTWSNPGDIVYDPFAGSGTTCWVADQMGRTWIGSEIAVQYHRVFEDLMKREFPHLLIELSS